MFAFLIIVIALIIWSLRLIQGAVKLRDSSMILASTLDGYMSYFTASHTLPLEEISQLLPSILYEPDTTVSIGVSELTRSTN
jgi:predicted neutral ceramidase superfamily lipid hydrolase